MYILLHLLYIKIQFASYENIFLLVKKTVYMHNNSIKNITFFI